MPESPIFAATPERHATLLFTPPPAPHSSWQPTELEDEVLEAVKLGSVHELSRALSRHDRFCGADHVLHAAIELRQTKALELLLSCCTMNHLVHTCCEGRTPLHHAVLLSHGEEDECFEMANMLLASGACVNARDALGETPLHYASLRACLATVKLLLKHNADANLKSTSGSTALHLLCGKLFFAAADDAILEALLARGAAPAPRDADGLRPGDYLRGWGMVFSTNWVSALAKKLVLAEQQQAQEERWQARRSCVLMHARSGCGHIICRLPKEVFRTVVCFL